MWVVFISLVVMIHSSILAVAQAPRARVVLLNAPLKNDGQISLWDRWHDITAAGTSLYLGDDGETTVVFANNNWIVSANGFVYCAAKALFVSLVGADLQQYSGDTIKYAIISKQAGVSCLLVSWNVGYYRSTDGSRFVGQSEVCDDGSIVMREMTRTGLSYGAYVNINYMNAAPWTPPPTTISFVPATNTAYRIINNTMSQTLTTSDLATASASESMDVTSKSRSIRLSPSQLSTTASWIASYSITSSVSATRSQSLTFTQTTTDTASQTSTMSSTVSMSRSQSQSISLKTITLLGTLSLTSTLTSTDSASITPRASSSSTETLTDSASQTSTVSATKSRSRVSNSLVLSKTVTPRRRTQSLTQTETSLKSISTKRIWASNSLLYTASLSSCFGTPICQVLRPTEAGISNSLCGETPSGSCVCLQPATLRTEDSATANAQVDRAAFESAGALLVALSCLRPWSVSNRSTVVTYGDVLVKPLTIREDADGITLLQLSLPRGAGDMRKQNAYKAFSMAVPISMECLDNEVNMTLNILVAPSGLPMLALGPSVQATDRAAMWLGSAIGGTAGGSVSRVAAMRALLLCSPEGASTGGILGLSLGRASDLSDTLSAFARGAIVGNMVLFAGWLLVLLILAGVYYAKSGPAVTTVSAACARVALPSSLLPMCGALLPSTSGAVMVLAQAEEMDALNSLTLFAGCALCMGILLPLLCLSYQSLAVKTLDITLIEVRRRAFPNEASASGFSLALHRMSTLWRRVTKRCWKWRSSDANHDRSLAARCCSFVLVEHRYLWYPALDMSLLCVTGILGAASGVTDSKAVCSGAAISVVVLVLLQGAVVVAIRPFTSLFSTVHAAFVLLFTGLGAALQVASIVNDNGSLQDWALLGSAVCGFLVVGTSIGRAMVMDAPKAFAQAKLYVRDIQPTSAQHVETMNHEPPPACEMNCEIPSACEESSTKDDDAPCNEVLVDDLEDQNLEFLDEQFWDVKTCLALDIETLSVEIDNSSVVLFDVNVFEDLSACIEPSPCIV